MNQIPYYTADDESQWCGHIWKQREYIGGRWGFMWTVLPPYAADDGDAVAGGWEFDQGVAESRMREVLSKYSNGSV